MDVLLDCMKMKKKCVSSRHDDVECYQTQRRKDYGDEEDETRSVAP